MPELVLRPSRRHLILMPALFGALLVASVALLTEAYPLHVVLGIIVVIGVHRMFAARLTLTRDGFAIGSHRVAWDDVSRFEPIAVEWEGVPVSGVVKVRFAPGCQLYGYVRATEAAGRFKLYLPPSYLSQRYAAANEDLCQLMQRWHRRYRSS